MPAFLLRDPVREQQAYTDETRAPGYPDIPELSAAFAEFHPGMLDAHDRAIERLDRELAGL